MPDRHHTSNRVRFDPPSLSVHRAPGGFNVEFYWRWTWGRYEWPGGRTAELCREHGLVTWMIRGFGLGPFRLERWNPNWPG